MVLWLQTMHLSCVKILGVPLGVSKMISEPMVHLAQTMHLSCTNTNTISKWTKMRLQMTHDTKEFHQLHQKQFPSLWYVQRKTVRLSCVKFSNISKQTEMSFHLSLINYVT
jgi:c-di-GMP-binding flagellar brake protein YcgR